MKGISVINQKVRSKTASWLLIFLFGSLCSYSMAGAQEKLTLSATLSATSVAVDSTATLTVTVNGSRSAEIDIPEVENLIFHRRGQSSSMHFMNGSLSSSISTKFIIQPLQEGTFTIPPFNVIADNKTLTTEPLSLEVTSSLKPTGSTVPQDNNDNSDEIAFIAVSGLKEKGYTGEIIPVEIKAYFRRGIRVEIQRLPEIRGDAFVISPPSDEPSQTIESRGGKSYSVITWNSSITPIKEGNYDFIVDLDATLYLPQKSSRSRMNRNPFFRDDFFNDDFFNDIFGGFQEKKVTLASERQSFTAEPLPEAGRPDDFGGAVGEFSFEIAAKPRSVKVGDPITLTMTISGKGNFDRVTAPLFPSDSNWKTYSPVANFKSSGSEYSGDKIFEQAVVVNNTTINEIPSLHFSYFDPIRHQYVTRSTEALPLSIEKEAESATVPAPPLSGNVKKPESAAPEQTGRSATIRLSTNKFTDDIRPVFREVWFIAVAVACTLILLIVAALILRKHYLLKNEDSLQRKIQLARIQEKLNLLQKNIQNNDNDAFLKNCREIIQCKLGLVWKVEPTTITLSDLQQKLSADSPLLEIFRAAEQQAYGGTYLDKELGNYLNILEKELEGIS